MRVRVCARTFVHVLISPKTGTSTNVFGLTPASLQVAAVQIMFLALRKVVKLVPSKPPETDTVLRNHEITHEA